MIFIKAFFTCSKRGVNFVKVGFFFSNSSLMENEIRKFCLSHKFYRNALFNCTPIKIFTPPLREWTKHLEKSLFFAQKPTLREWTKIFLIEKFFMEKIFDI
ncbi:unnamed protein product [Blepharisma stoltei]|uniref:Uncharacterized protein n=1 Tax=Blepharisma stoltei TaxID=1481888 RepID=A0AAU9JB30_9CILI|nr:unnamed protein product [Blepharisma stoltei]